MKKKDGKDSQLGEGNVLEKIYDFACLFLNFKKLIFLYIGISVFEGD